MLYIGQQLGNLVLPLLHDTSVDDPNHHSASTSLSQTNLIPSPLPHPQPFNREDNRDLKTLRDALRTLETLTRSIPVNTPPPGIRIKSPIQDFHTTNSLATPPVVPVSPSPSSVSGPSTPTSISELLPSPTQIFSLPPPSPSNHHPLNYSTDAIPGKRRIELSRDQKPTPSFSPKWIDRTNSRLSAQYREQLNAMERKLRMARLGVGPISEERRTRD